MARAPIRYGEPEHTHIELAQIVLDESGYTAHWQNDKTPEAPGRLENLKELVNQLDNFENLQGFLEHVSLVMDNEQDSDGAKVSIMTLHAAKGLEFPAIFLPGWEDGLFPSQRSMDESGIKGLEEERRLAYVGITRAEEVCTISFAANRRVFGQWQNSMPSRFIDELPEDHVEVLTPPGLYGGGQTTASIETRAAEANVYNSPGWKRMQARQGQYGMSQPRESRNTVIDATAVASFTLGERVFHQKFGYGGVIGIEGDKVEVDFDKAGTKKGCRPVPVSQGRRAVLTGQIPSTRTRFVVAAALPDFCQFHIIRIVFPGIRGCKVRNFHQHDPSFRPIAFDQIDGFGRNRQKAPSVPVENRHEARKISLIGVRIVDFDLSDEIGCHGVLRGLEAPCHHTPWAEKQKKRRFPGRRKGNRRSCQHQSREEESPDVSEPGFEPGMRKTRRRQGGGRRRRALSTSGQGGGEPRCIRLPAFEAGIRCGSIREEERCCR